MQLTNFPAEEEADINGPQGIIAGSKHAIFPFDQFTLEGHCFESKYNRLSLYIFAFSYRYYLGYMKHTGIFSAK